MDHVTIFQVAPFQENTLQRIRALPLNQLYSLFEGKENDDILTAALYVIYENKKDKSSYDTLLFNRTLNTYPYVFLLLRDGIYVEHLYVWLVNNSNNSGSVTNIIGNVTNLYPFLNSIYLWTRTMTAEKPAYYLRLLRVLQPSQASVATLHRAGFILAKTVGGQEPLQWLFNNSSIGDTPLVENLLFRKYDYIALVE